MAKKKIRLLVDQVIDGTAYRCNDVVELPAELAKPLIETGSADDNKEAVAYCLNELEKIILVHAAPVIEAVIEAPAAVEADQTVISE